MHVLDAVDTTRLQGVLMVQDDQRFVVNIAVLALAAFLHLKFFAGLLSHETSLLHVLSCMSIWKQKRFFFK